MFLHHLQTEAEKAAFVRLVARVLHSKGHVALEEAQLGRMYLSELGVTDVLVLLSGGDEELDTLAEAVSSRPAQRASLVALLTLAYADDVLQSGERELLLRLAKLWRVSEHQVAEMEAWAMRFVAELHVAERFIGAGDHA